MSALHAVLAAVACSSAAAVAEPPRCTIPHASAWREYRSAHFVVATDVRRSTAASLVENLERTHALVVQALFGEQVEIPGRVRVVAFGNPTTFEAFAPKDAGGYVRHGPEGSAIVVPFEGRAPLPNVVAHEVTHRISWFAFPRQPRWYQEGMAQFVETVGTTRFDDAPSTGTHLSSGGRRTSGRWAGLAPSYLRREASGRLVPVKELLEWRGAVDPAEPWRHQATSWLLYHWLWNKRSKQLTAFQQRLSNGEDPAAAWGAALPEYDPGRPASLATLDEELAGYRASGRYLSYRVDVADPDSRFAEAPIAPADLHMLLLAVRARWPEKKEEADALARAEAEEALREDPAQPDALDRQAIRAGQDLAAALRPAVAAHPGSARAWLLLGRALDEKTKAAEREAALRKAVALDPESASANNDLAWLLVTTGRAREARPFADRALDLAPWDRDIVDTLAVVAMGIGQCKAALQLERRAADLYGTEKAGDAIRARLAEYEAKCGAGVQKAP